MSSRILQPTTNIVNHSRDLGKAAKHVASDLQTEAANKLGPLQEMAQDQISSVRGHASDSWETLKGFVKQHPFASVGIGVFGGLILAAWARRD
jgi:ElaB/YqjD/DUF883 family membrane-anchored ribosome-binding protein